MIFPKEYLRLRRTAFEVTIISCRCVMPSLDRSSSCFTKRPTQTTNFGGFIRWVLDSLVVEDFNDDAISYELSE